MDVDIRRPAEEEFEPLLRTAWPAFGQHVDESEFQAELRVNDPGRALAAVEGGRFVGELMSVPLRLVVPGGTVSVDGVTSAGVLPTHRRRGILTALMRRHLEQVRERGEPISVLHASEGPIYGHFGYGIGTWSCRVRIDRHRSAFAASVPLEGSLRLVERDEAMKVMPPVYERAVRDQPGAIERSEAWWEYSFQDTEHDREGASAYFFAVHDTAEGIEGYVAYRVKSNWSSTGPGHTLMVTELMAATPPAYTALWRYCFDVDLVGRIDAFRRSPNEPLLHLLADPRAMRLKVGDGMWVRLVDVKTALSARTYATANAINLEVRDGFCEWNDGRYRLEGGPDGATCTSTEDDPDVILSAADLGAVYLGGNRFDDLARAGRAQEVTPGALERGDMMFWSLRTPWNPHMF